MRPGSPIAISGPHFKHQLEGETLPPVLSLSPLLPPSLYALGILSEEGQGIFFFPCFSPSSLLIMVKWPKNKLKWRHNLGHELMFT